MWRTSRRQRRRETRVLCSVFGKWGVNVSSAFAAAHLKLLQSLSEKFSFSLVFGTRSRCRWAQSTQQCFFFFLPLGQFLSLLSDIFFLRTSLMRSKNTCRQITWINCWSEPCLKGQSSLFCFFCSLPCPHWLSSWLRSPRIGRPTRLPLPWPLQQKPAADPPDLTCSPPEGEGWPPLLSPAGSAPWKYKRDFQSTGHSTLMVLKDSLRQDY